MTVAAAFGALVILSSFTTPQGARLNGAPPKPSTERFLTRVRVLGVQVDRGEALLAKILCPDGTTRTWRKGDRVTEEDAVVKDVTRSTLVLTRAVTGASGEKGESLIVVRYDSSGKVTVREYSTVSDWAPPSPPRRPPQN